MTYFWRTYGHSRVHHVSEEGHGKRPLCEMTTGHVGTTTVREPGAPDKCIQCAREVVRVVEAVKASRRFQEVE